MEEEKNMVSYDITDKENSKKVETKTKESHKYRKQNTLKIQKGTEKVIDGYYFSKMNLVSKNIMLMALKNRVDIKSILDETELLMKKDERTNADSSSSWSWMPILEKTMIFLTIIADKLNCNVQEFFIDNEETCKRYVYNLLEEIEDEEWTDGYVDAETGNAEISIRSYDASLNREIKIDYLGDTMDLIISREYYDNIPYYQLSYGSLHMRENTAYDYMIKGAYLLEEEKGKLQELVEKLIEQHTEWIE